ncbi:MAG: aldehyde dehydrogenase family protein [Myxococcales bacterium]|nr:aldehyde dehydrogenase family protein [Myxococcales bacterium]
MATPREGVSDELVELFAALDLPPPAPPHTGGLVSEDPSRGVALARLPLDTIERARAKVTAACDAFTRLRLEPGPARGELVRRMGNRLREHKDALARIVCAEVGKCIEEARGEVQEMIDICDFAVGLSRSLGGRTMLSERPGHRMFEQWLPLGPVLCISAFNFPVAVWSWNAAIALVCGDPVVWKPSLKAPLCALATHQLLQPVLADAGLGDALQLVIGPDDPVTTALVDDPRLPLVSATGSCAMGRAVAPRVAARLGRSLLELGGNNAIIVDATADLELAARAIVFGAAGTAGQRCTTTRRLFVERTVAGALTERLVAAYRQLQGRVGDPRDPETLVGPLIDGAACARFAATIEEIRAHGGELLAGGELLDRPGYFVQPTLARVPDARDFPPIDTETFAPILYIKRFDDGAIESAIEWNNRVEQGLSSALFSDSVRAVERFWSPAGSDCGIANVNLGTSGAEIGGAFGGEKATGGGREAGSDAWKAYMRRQTCTVNGSRALPLAQGIRWD